MNDDGAKDWLQSDKNDVWWLDLIKFKINKLILQLYFIINKAQLID